MNPRALLTIALLCFCTCVFSAGFTHSYAVESKSKVSKTLSLKEMEYLTGRKLTFFERVQFFMARGQLKKQQKAGIFPEREELTEGFRPLAFFGSLFTGGLLCIIMLFTERDANAFRWAQWGLWIVAAALAISTVVFAVIEGGY